VIERIIRRLRAVVKDEPEHPRLPALRDEVRRAGERVREHQRWADSFRRRTGRAA